MTRNELVARCLGAVVAYQEVVKTGHGNNARTARAFLETSLEYFAKEYMKTYEYKLEYLENNEAK